MFCNQFLPSTVGGDVYRGLDAAALTGMLPSAWPIFFTGNFGREPLFIYLLAAAQAYFVSGRGRRAANGVVQTASPQPIEKGVTGVAVDQSHVPGIGVWQDGLRTEFRGDGRHAGGHFIQGVVPTDQFEFAGTLGAGPSEGGCNAFRRVDVLWKVAGFAAYKTVGEGMLRVALDSYDPPALDLGQQATGVGTIMWASAVDG